MTKAPLGNVGIGERYKVKRRQARLNKKGRDIVQRGPGLQKEFKDHPVLLPIKQMRKLRSRENK